MREPDWADERAATILKRYLESGKCDALIPAIAAALRDERAEADKLRSHLPDCCAGGTCNTDEKLTHADVACMFMQELGTTFPALAPMIHANSATWVKLIDRLGDLAHLAVRSAIEDREREIERLRSMLR